MAHTTTIDRSPARHSSLPSAGRVVDLVIAAVAAAFISSWATQAWMHPAAAGGPAAPSAPRSSTVDLPSAGTGVPDASAVFANGAARFEEPAPSF